MCVAVSSSGKLTERLLVLSAQDYGEIKPKTLVSEGLRVLQVLESISNL